MGERILMAWSVDETALARLVGSRNPAVRQVALAHSRIVADLDAGYGFAEPATSTAELLDEVLEGRLDRAHALEYRRLLELLAEVVGDRLAPRLLVVPGYGLNRFGPVLSHWGLPVLGAAWDACDVHFPFVEPVDHDSWPKLIVVRSDRLLTALSEVRDFDGRSVSRDYPESPAAADLLSDPGEPLADPLDPHVSHVLDGIAAWVLTTLNHAGRSLLMMIDGDR